MTKTTDTRQLKLLIEGIIRSHGIDNLELEINVFQGVKRLLESGTPVRTRESYLSEIREALGANQAQQTMDEMIEVQFGRFPLNFLHFPEEDKDAFRRFLKSQDHSLEEFLNWWTQDEWRLAHPPHNLGKIMIMWPQAFQTVRESEYRQL